MAFASKGHSLLPVFISAHNRTVITNTDRPPNAYIGPTNILVVPIFYFPLSWDQLLFTSTTSTQQTKNWPSLVQINTSVSTKQYTVRISLVCVYNQNKPVRLQWSVTVSWLVVRNHWHCALPHLMNYITQSRGNVLHTSCGSLHHCRGYFKWSLEEH